MLLLCGLGVGRGCAGAVGAGGGAAGCGEVAMGGCVTLLPFLGPDIGFAIVFSELSAGCASTVGAGFQGWAAA